MQASVEVVAGTPVRTVIASQRLRSLPMPSQLADVPLQAMASTFASASRSAAGSITEASNWFSAAASSAISVTRKREKCAVTSATPASIALVTGSSTELEDGVIMPRRLRTIDIDRSRSVAAKALLRFLKGSSASASVHATRNLHAAYNLFDMHVF